MPSPRIRSPRSMYPSQSLSSRHHRFRKAAAVVGVFLAVYYVFCISPIDDLAVSWDRHETYMNDRANVDGFIAKGSYDWRTAPFHNKPESYTQLPTGTPKSLPKVQYDFPAETKAQKTLREKRRVAVRDEFLRSWESYKSVAWMKDELRPVSRAGEDTFGAWGATLVDALDTLWIMGLKNEFYEAVEAVAAIDFGKSGKKEMTNISVFETTIRYLGGLLSAYDLSHEKVLLDKAIQLGEMLYRAFDTSNHMPLDRLSIEPAKNKGGTGFVADGSICFANLGSLGLEFTRLAQITQEPKFYDAVSRVTTLLDANQNLTRLPGVFPTWMNAYKEDMTYDRSFTLGAMADSSYEYFPKTHALLGGLDPVFEKLYKDSAAVIDKHMLFRPMLPDPSYSSDLLIAGNVYANNPDDTRLDPEGQHLTCFIGGYFALAGKLFSSPHDVELGEKLTNGCIWAYKSMPTGIMPEIFDVVACESRTHCPWNETLYATELSTRSGLHWKGDLDAALADVGLPKGMTAARDKRYLLRPEAIESVFILYRVTGNQSYADSAWDMYTSIVQHTSTAFGNGQLVDVTDASGESRVEDKMESFWLAETLKYFYLIFSSPDMISLDDWVLNTEAHPFRRPKAADSKIHID